jgi:hypothetical protein
MTPEELDRILSSDDRLEPSSDFAKNVMLSLRREADEPAPLRFPWWRFASGIAASGGIASGATVLLLQWDVLAAPVHVGVPAIVYAFAMLLVSLGIAAVPRVLSKP